MGVGVSSGSYLWGKDDTKFRCLLKELHSVEIFGFSCGCLECVLNEWPQTAYLVWGFFLRSYYSIMPLLLRNYFVKTEKKLWKKSFSHSSFYEIAPSHFTITSVYGLFYRWCELSLILTSETFLTFIWLVGCF